MTSQAIAPRREASAATARTMLANVREIAPRLAARGAEFEAARRMPVDIVGDLRDIGVFGMYAPKRYGGLELDFPDSLDILAALAEADGSVGWTAFIGAGIHLFISLLPKEGLDQVYANGPDALIAGSAAMMGRAERVDGGFRVSGRWPFASGCQHAEWIWGGCRVAEGGEPAAGPAAGPAPGAPLYIAGLLPASEWTIEDTWQVAGLKGTGSSHIVLQDAFVPASNTFSLSDSSSLPGPLHVSPVGVLVPLTSCGPAIGIAEGAIYDLVAMANGGRQQAASRTALRDSPLFQADLGRIEAEVKAARALAEVTIARHWRLAEAGDLDDDVYITEAVQTATWVTLTCQRAVDACYALGGGAALYESSPLQRRLRDIHAATQHVVVQPKHYLAAGQQRLGFPPRNPLLG